MPTASATDPVLVVAQAPAIRRRLVEALQARGVPTVEAVGTIDAIRTMAPSTPSRIVVASRLGDERGMALARMLARVEKTARIPLVLVVGDPDGVKELKGAKLRPAVQSVMASETVEVIVARILDAQPAPPIRAAAGAPVVEPGRIPVLDEAFAFFDELLDLIVNEQLPGPVVPDLLLRVQQLFADPRLDGRRVVAFVREHQTLAARVLRMANSAYYGMSSRVDGIDDAVTRIGLGKVKDALQAAAALEYLGATTGRLRNAIGASLGRGYFVGMLSEGLAAEVAPDDSERAFSIGLFHNIGVTFLLYAAAILQEKQRRPLPDLGHLVTTAHHESLRANRVLRRAMYLPPEVEALHGDVELARGEFPPDPLVMGLVQQAMWAADRLLPDGALPLVLDGDAQLIGMDAKALARANPIMRKLLPTVATYRR